VRRCAGFARPGPRVHGIGQTASQFPAWIGAPGPSGGSSVTGQPVADGLGVFVGPPHADLCQPRQTSRCRHSTCRFGRDRANRMATSCQDRSPRPRRGNNVTSQPVADGLGVFVGPPHGDLSWPRQTSRWRLSTCDAGRRWRPVELVGNLKGFSTNPQDRCRPGPSAWLAPGYWRAAAAARRPPRVSWIDEPGLWSHREGSTICSTPWDRAEFAHNRAHRPGPVLAVALRWPLMVGAQPRSLVNMISPRPGGAHEQIHHLFKSLESRQPHILPLPLPQLGNRSASRRGARQDPAPTRSEDADSGAGQRAGRRAGEAYGRTPQRVDPAQRRRIAPKAADRREGARRQRDSAALATLTPNSMKMRAAGPQPTSSVSPIGIACRVEAIRPSKPRPM